ncbi:M1 family aminopeptidase [Pseudonocardia bannensis]|uniref:M1 family metallopeptidase n=1 Tax=Pseudonocardia bannensis TaxID=630973 RepID=A0A848DKK9_9PSEU|nr:M1 family aminopeptidase [Pseudonocardia bannensis]NMH93089.1 M1 family metallopeptidase [Pseudonocardia bannensis]
MWVLVLVLALAGLVACAPAPGPAPPPGPAIYEAALWPARPVVELAFTVAPDLRTAEGRETVVFTPDLPVCELVFRAWPNTPTMARTGTALTVTDTSVDGRPTTARITAAGAPPGAPGTLIEIPLTRCLNPGESVHAELGFRVTLGVDADERIGYSTASHTAWIGSGFPLLAWVRGKGWARDPAVPMNGESATSEVFVLRDLSVTAPPDLRVMGTGTAVGAAMNPAGTVHSFLAPAVRDVAVAVGRYDILDRDVGGVRLHLATPQTGTRVDPETWVTQFGEAITALTGVFGPFPYPDLWITITPGQSDGTEFPAALQLADTRRRQLAALIAHELTHQWFYALVGNNQATDPWLDEALATVGETLARAGGGDVELSGISRRGTGEMGRPMTYWAANGGFDRYTESVYAQGAAVFLEARAQVGPERFDNAIRSYIAANAHRVATPDDLSRAFRDLPEVLDLLTRTGALPANR